MLKVIHGYFKNMEVQIILSLLKIIDNPIQDIPLLTVLRSQIGYFTIDELTEIRLIDKNCTFFEAMQKSAGQRNQKVIDFLNKLENWREESKYLSLSEFIWKLYIDTDYYYYVMLLPGGEKRQANLKLLIEKAEIFEKTSYKGLFSFLNFIDNLKESNADYGSSKIISESENVVRIMSIHKSKGLEFPIVFLAGINKRFNMQDLSNKIIFHQELGFGTDIIKPEKRITYPSIQKLALKQKIRLESLSEEMRILYVAMTRAKEKLIITGMTKDINKQIEKWNGNINKYNISKALSFADWIGKSILNKKDNTWEIKFWLYDDVIKMVDENVFNINKKLFENIENNNIESDSNIAEINKKLSWEYPYIKSTNLPTKTTVTEIKQLYNISDISEIKQEISEIIEKPEFMKDDTKLIGASYGTIIHTILQKINYNNLEIKSILNKLNILENDDIYFKIINDINKYINSNIFKRSAAAQNIHRETHFNLNIPANEIYNLDDKYKMDKIMIQGIIDLYFIENNEIVIVDYKTNNVLTDDELINKYNIQLKYYRKALEEITKMKVKETYIYSFKLSKEILIK